MATDLPAGVSPDELYVVPASRMLHSDDCQHQTEKSFAVMQSASAEEIAEYELCKSCRRVLTGGRRHYFPSFEEALRAYQAPVENRSRMREIAAEHDPAIIWIPPAGTYIALAPGKGLGATAHFHKSHVDEHINGFTVREDLPSAYVTASRSAKPAQERELGVCPSCFMELLTSGKCGACT